jgi:hypothetical protein
MTAVINDNTFSLHCQSEVSDGYLRYTGTFTRMIPFTPDQTHFDSIIEDIDQIGQRVKREVTVSRLESADHQNAQFARTLIKLLVLIPCFPLRVSGIVSNTRAIN